MSQEIRLKKNDIRKEVLLRRDSLSADARKAASIMMTDRILGHQWFYRAKYILIYVSYGSEIDTEELILEALKLGKKVYVPKVEGNTMEFYEIYAMSDLQPGYRSIREPDGTSPKYWYSKENAEQTLMLMPGVAFDPYKNRLGYGKGFYDRYLEQKPELLVKTIAIGFRCQMVDQIPYDENDRKPYQILLT